MIIHQLELKSFRNYEHAVFKPGNGLNVLYGENAQGKTNLLEAIYMLSTSRSLRAVKEAELIRWGEETASVKAHISNCDGLETDLEINLSKTERKQVKLNGVSHTRALDLIGHLPTVTFSSIDLNITRGEPADRRRFLDIELSQISPRYTFDYVKFKRALDQRNQLLKRHLEGSGGLETLELWDVQLVENGAKVMEARNSFINRLAPLVEKSHYSLTNNKERLSLVYVPNIKGGEEKCWQEKFMSSLKSRRQEELRRGATVIGPQRDDIQLLIDGHDVKLFGSQGQQRTAVLSIKLAEAEMLQEETNESPVALLDDVMSDLDDHRKSKVMGFLEGVSQVIITCTDLHAFPKKMLNKAQIFTVHEGTAIPQ